MRTCVCAPPPPACVCTPRRTMAWTAKAEGGRQLGPRGLSQGLESWPQLLLAVSVLPATRGHWPPDLGAWAWHLPHPEKAGLGRALGAGPGCSGLCGLPPPPSPGRSFTCRLLTHMPVPTIPGPAHPRHEGAQRQGPREAGRHHVLGRPEEQGPPPTLGHCRGFPHSHSSPGPRGRTRGATASACRPPVPSGVWGSGKTAGQEGPWPWSPTPTTYPPCRPHPAKLPEEGATPWGSQKDTCPLVSMTPEAWETQQVFPGNQV